MIRTVITPNSFIHPLSPPDILIREDKKKYKCPDKTTRETVIKTLDARNEMLKNFEKMWISSYLLSMREKTRDQRQPDFANKIKVNDIVLIKNPIKSRPFWSLGRVVQLYPGHDSIVRSVQVQRGDQVKQNYALKHLYPLEIGAETRDNTDIDSVDEADSTDQPAVIDPQLIDDSIRVDTRQHVPQVTDPVHNNNTGRRSERLKAKSQSKQ